MKHCRGEVYDNPKKPGYGANSREVLIRGSSVLFSPVCRILRHPFWCTLRWTRNQR